MKCLAIAVSLAPLPALASVFALSATATFEVSKFFDDLNPADVEVTISCNTGLPLEQSKRISQGDPVTFVVRDFDETSLDCAISETDGPAGYAAKYNNGAGLADDACEYSGLSESDNICSIVNVLQPVIITVSKVWVDENPDFNLPQSVRVTLHCDVEIEGVGGVRSEEGGGAAYMYHSTWIDPDKPAEFWLYPKWSGSHCEISETQRGGFIPDTSDCDELYVEPGLNDACTVVNTRLYEGIPTLSQNGLIIMTLSMLGIGILGFRRFV